ncbi:MAG: homoserine kinase [Planctomycetota bacterium]
MSGYRVLAPASTSNLGPGFDTLGVAVDLSLEVLVEESPASGFGVVVSGEGSDILPADGRNVVLRTAREIAGNAVDTARWTINSQIPVSRGLGSSGAANAAGYAAGYLLRDGRMPPRHEIFLHVARSENHPDNAAATVFGGFRIAGRESSGNWASTPGLLGTDTMQLLIVIPEIPVSTQQARSILPVDYSRGDTVRNLQSLGTLLSGLARGDWEAVRRGCTDRLHEPYRLPLVPGLADALTTLRNHPAVGGAYLSGAGPILVAFLPEPDAIDNLPQAAVDALEQQGTQARAVVSSVQQVGLQSETLP